MTSTCTKTSRVRMRLAIAVCLLGSLIIGAQADLEFYNPRPAEPKVGGSSSSLEQLVRYLESRRQQRSHLSHAPLQIDEDDNDDDDDPEGGELSEENTDDGDEDDEEQQQQLRRRQQHLLSLALQKQRGLFRDDLPERPSIIDALQREAQRDPLEYVRELDRQRLLPYLEYEPAPRVKPYPLKDEMRARLMPSQLGSDPRLDYPEPQQQQQQQHEVAKHPSLESVLARKLELMAAIAAAARMHQLRERLQQQQDEQQQARRRQPEFTFSFGKVATGTDDDTPRPFAVAPNDPRYYEEEPPLVDQHTDEETLKMSRFDTPAEQHQLQQQQQKQKQTIASEMQDENSDLQGPRQSISVTNKAIIEATTSRKIWKSARDENEADWLPEVNVGPVTSSFAFGMLPEPQRRAEHDPLVVSLDKDGSNRDLYFIVLVAGCSAAAMFALVLISLTWCRLRRDSKAAADVDYPAYGVTGPNKVVSPSGDQRLAQSAQMFHFQHQKQQIIAMEKSSNQEAGSVSEPESDEENDEGDYTVYECPGLAPTGEMEVKNPLFHDDSVTSQKSKPRPNGKDA
ncbi:uncharacterized protein LOC106655249 [Trichogramma pretiosum]|uniref:uncharacterized protein LOC106655249 n=1 Tax=Trichogramma pretiosum TaxID=7493 RepID=UPI0006C962A6|nr:uncharacterized protein LOC106655249 [Trichogramma pretiosum]